MNALPLPYADDCGLPYGGLKAFSTLSGIRLTYERGDEVWTMLCATMNAACAEIRDVKAGRHPSASNRWTSIAASLLPADYAGLQYQIERIEEHRLKGYAIAPELGPLVAAIDA